MSSPLFYFWHYVEHGTGLRIILEKFPLSGEVELFSFFRGPVCWLLAFGQVQYFKLISRNWRARQARSYTFGITLSTEQGCASFWKNSLCRGRLNYFHFFEDLSIGSGHFDWFSLLISRNWRARQDCSFTFGITLSTEQDCPLSLKNSPYRGRLHYFHFFEEFFFWLLAFGLVQYFDFTELACTSSSLFYIRHYVEHGTGLPIKSEKIPPIGEG